MNEKCTTIDGLHFSWMKINEGRWNSYNIIIQFKTQNQLWNLLSHDIKPWYYEHTTIYIHGQDHFNKAYFFGIALKNWKKKPILLSHGKGRWGEALLQPHWSICLFNHIIEQ